MRILGIDPGLQITGYGLIETRSARPQLVDAGVIRLNTKRPIPQRLVELESELQLLVDDLKPARIAVEQLYSHYAHPRTAILMGHARGVILLVAARNKTLLTELPANRVKQSLTGYGHASKQQMQRAVQLQFRLEKPPSPPDVADAIAIALSAARG